MEIKSIENPPVYRSRRHRDAIIVRTEKLAEVVRDSNRASEYRLRAALINLDLISQWASIDRDLDAIQEVLLTTFQRM